MNAKLDFGIPYTCRPTQLKGYYKYIPGVVNKVGDKYNGKFDFLRVQQIVVIFILLCAIGRKRLFRQILRRRVRLLIIPGIIHQYWLMVS